jgi:hypothetical protein
MGLEALIRLGEKYRRAKRFRIVGARLNGESRVKDEKIEELSWRALSLLRQSDSYRIVHVRREFNNWLVGRPIGTLTKR